jgi:uncharacterized membrane protein YfcA
MSEIILPMWAIAAVFLLVAVAYASVGLGGGSSYAALMVVFGFSSLSIPNLSLLLNLLVTTVSCFNFIRRGHLRIDLIAPFIVLSLPMAWLGGALQVPEQVFRLLMALSLVVVLVRIYAWNNTAIAHRFSRRQVVMIALALGAVLGFLAGVIGIGGGIFLVPAILLLGLGDMKQAAACGVVFVWLFELPAADRRGAAGRHYRIADRFVQDRVAQPGKSARAGHRGGSGFTVALAADGLSGQGASPQTAPRYSQR